jgi:hypothetical protein
VTRAGKQTALFSFKLFFSVRDTAMGSEPDFSYQVLEERFSRWH